MRAILGIDSEKEALSVEQRATFRKIADGPRGSVPRPFLAMLDAPELADAIQAVGLQIRFHSSLQGAHREAAILTVAGAVVSGYEWASHEPIARQTGVPCGVILATRPDGTIGSDLPAPWDTIIALCRSLVVQRCAPEALMAEAITLFGRQGVTELVAICGYYSLLATFLKCAGTDRDFEPLTE